MLEQLKKIPRYIHSLVAPASRVLRVPDRSLMMRYGGLRLKAMGGAYVEVGAGRGGNAVGFMRLHGLDPKIGHLIEASPENFRAMKETVTGFNIYNLAISSRGGTVPFYVIDGAKSDKAWLSNSTDLGYLEKKFPEKNFRRIDVPSMTLDGFLDDAKIGPVGFAVFNCEGSEYEIFAGDLRFLERVELLYLDLHGKVGMAPEFIEKKKDIVRRILATGMELVGGSRIEDIDHIAGHLSFLFERASAKAA